MPLKPNTVFVRQSIPTCEHIGMVIPPNARMLPEIEKAISQHVPGFEPSPPSEPPTGFSFHYVEAPVDQGLLVDGMFIDNGIYEFKVRDAVLGVFDLPAFQDDEFSWSFSSMSQLAVLAAVKIGETLDIEFDKTFDRVFHVTKRYLSLGIPESGYGTFPIHLTIDSLNRKGFRVVSSYERESPKTDSRLPFLFGFRVYGRFEEDPEFPIWRELLAQAIRQVLFSRWDLGLLFTAFAVESFIDNLLSAKLSVADLGKDYTEHVLQVGDRRHELHALNHQGLGLSKSQVNKKHERLNEQIFTPRNELAHGKTMGTKISTVKAVNAIKAAVEFIWDWNPDARQLLLARMKPIRFEDLIDDDLLRACGAEPPTA